MLVRTYKERSKNPIEPVRVGSDPVKESIFEGVQVNLLELPVPNWHERDGGRYIGTFDGVVTKDPESGSIASGVSKMPSQKATGFPVSSAC